MYREINILPNGIFYYHWYKSWRVMREMKQPRPNNASCAQFYIIAALSWSSKNRLNCFITCLLCRLLDQFFTFVATKETELHGGFRLEYGMFFLLEWKLLITSVRGRWKTTNIRDFGLFFLLLAIQKQRAKIIWRLEVTCNVL